MVKTLEPARQVIPDPGILTWDRTILYRPNFASSANNANSAASAPHFQLQLGIILSPEKVSCC